MAETYNTRMLSGFSEAVVRFPVCTLIACVATIVVNLDSTEILHLGQYDARTPSYQQTSMSQILPALIAAFFASGAAHLFAEARFWKHSHSIAVATIAAFAAATPFWLIGALGQESLLMFWLPGIVLLVFIAGFLNGGGG